MTRICESGTKVPRGLKSTLLALFVASLVFAAPADWIWTGRYVITMDPARRVIENGALAIQGAKIIAVGTRTEIDARYQPQHRLDRPDAILSPGFIDTHTHAPMSLFRAIADDKRLQDWLQNYIFPAEARNVDAEFVRWGTRLACLEMALYGTTTFADMYYFEDTLAETTREAGLRGVLGETIIGFPAPDYKTPEAALAATERYIRRFKGDPLITPAVAPHSVYTLADGPLKASRALASKYGVPLLIHLSETKKENEDLLANRKLTPTQLLDTLGVLNGRTVCAHGVWLDNRDLDILKRHGTGLAHCPTSNTKIASGVARVVEILERGINMGLGTDGFAGSNDGADLMQEMGLASKLQKVTTLNPEALPAEQALEMATIIGARALGLDGQIGSLEVGKLADIISISLTGPEAVPLYNPYSLLVYSLKSKDVSDVMVNGRLIVERRKMLTINQDLVMTKAVEYQHKISASLSRNK